MKKALVSLYIFFCTGGTYAQDRQNTVVAEIDFNKPAMVLLNKADTIRATLLITRDCMQYAHSYEGYAVIRPVPGKFVLSGDTLALQRDTIYLDDRMRPLKAPVTVWNMRRKGGPAMKKPFEGAEFEMTVSPELEQQVKEQFNLEIEILQGTRQPLSDGRNKITVHIADEQKYIMVREFVLRLISKSDQIIPN